MKRGFTLIELLFTISLIAIVSTFVFTAFVEYGNQQVFQSAVVEVASVIKETRQKTLSSETTTQFGVYFAADHLVVFEGSVYNPASITNQIKTLPGVTITPVLTGGVSEFVFTRLTGEPTATGVVTITDNRSGSTEEITILSSGLIE
ncbi:MAG: type II secretion system protein [Patescibacteria group bacterium]